MRAKRNSKIHLRQVMIHCKQCKLETSKYKGSHYNIIKEFCSRECAYTWRRLNPKIGSENPIWKGEKAGYIPKHIWINKHYGKASHCENDFTHKAKRFEYANISGKYLRDRNDYKMLCPSCHRRMDYFKKYGNFCRNGHEFNEENTIINSIGYRNCKICRNNNREKRRLRNG